MSEHSYLVLYPHLNIMGTLYYIIMSWSFDYLVYSNNTYNSDRLHRCRDVYAIRHRLFLRVWGRRCLSRWPCRCITKGLMFGASKV